MEFQHPFPSLQEGNTGLETMSTIWFYFLSAFYTWFTLCLGDATNLAIINLTPYDLVQSKEPHSYQMVAWDDAFPSSVPGRK